MISPVLLASVEKITLYILFSSLLAFSLMVFCFYCCWWFLGGLWVAWMIYTLNVIVTLVWWRRKKCMTLCHIDVSGIKMAFFIDVGLHWQDVIFRSIYPFSFYRKKHLSARVEWYYIVQWVTNVRQILSLFLAWNVLSSFLILQKTNEYFIDKSTC